MLSQTNVSSEEVHTAVGDPSPLASVLTLLRSRRFGILILWTLVSGTPVLGRTGKRRIPLRHPRPVTVTFGHDARPRKVSLRGSHRKTRSTSRTENVLRKRKSPLFVLRKTLFTSLDGRGVDQSSSLSSFYPIVRFLKEVGVLTGPTMIPDHLKTLHYHRGEFCISGR